MYLQLLGQAAQTYDCRVIAYCLMSTHVHLALELGADRLGSLTRAIHVPFGNWLGHRREADTPAFSQRPLSVVIDAQAHGAHLIRYIHNNPVRAGLVKRAQDSDWSSHRAYLGLDEAPEWLSVDALLGQQGPRRSRALAEFASFVDEGRFEPRRRDLCRGAPRPAKFRVLGPDDFVAETERIRHGQAQTSDRDRCGLNATVLREAVYKAFQIDPADFTGRDKPRTISRIRALVVWTWVERLGGAQKEVARALEVQPSAICKILGKLRKNGVTVREALIIDDMLKTRKTW